MAENNEEFEKIKQMSSAEQMLESIEGKADPFAGYSMDELHAIIGVLNGFKSSAARDAVAYAIHSEMTRRQDAQQPVQSDEIPDNQPAPADSQEQQPETIETDAPIQDDAKDFYFITEPSYSQYKTFEALNTEALKENKTLSEEQTKEMTDIVNNAQKVVDLAANEKITPENAVLLKDYINILRDAKTFDIDEKEKIDALEKKVDTQLETFDKENGLGELKGISAEELEKRENTLYKIADGRLQARYGNTELSTDIDKEFEILKQLAVQEMKTSPLYPSDELLEAAAQKIGATKEDIATVFNKGIAGLELNDVQKQAFDTLYKEVIIDKAREFDQKFDELKDQFEATKAIERAKLSADELYPEKEGMTPKELEEVRKKRKEYIFENSQKSEKEWVEENALRALKDKYYDENLSDEELLKKYGKEFDDIKEAYTNVSKEISSAVKVALVTRVDLLANRSARITKSPDINPNTKEFLQDFAKNNPKSYALGKAALTIGKSIVLTQGIRYAAGFKGMAVYSAYTTHKAIKKSWNEYKKQAQANGQKANLAGYWGYLKEHQEERADLLGKVAKTTIMSTLAIAGTVTGIDNVPGVSAALVGVTNAATSVAKFAYKLKDFKNKNPKATKWGLIGAGVAAVGTAAVAAVHFLPEETKEKIGGFFNGLAEKIGFSKDDDNMSDLDKKLIAEPGGKGLTDAEREQLLTNVDNLKNNSSGDVTDPLNLKSGENTDTPTVDGNNGNTADVTPTTEVPTLSENDINLLKTDCKMGPDPIVAKLQQMGVLSDEDKEKLIGSGGRKDGVASRVLASYLGHPYDGTQVPVHANLTPEQQQELNQFLHSEEYQHQCNECNAADNARRIAKLRGKVSKDDLGGNGNGVIDGNSNGNGFKLEKVNDDNTNTTPVQTKYSYDVSQRKKAIFNIVNKSLNTENTEVDLSKYYTQQQLSQMTPEQIEKASMQAAAYQYIEEHGVMRAEIVDAQGNVHTYYRQDMHKDGVMTTKRVDRMADGHKVTTEVNGAQNGATRVDYKGKVEQVTFTDEQGNTVHVGGEGEDKIKKVIVDPTTGKEYTLVKGDDGKTYTLEKDMKTGQTTVRNDMSSRQLNKIFKEAKNVR